MLPAVPVKVEVGLDGVLTVPPVPLIILQAPVPTDGVLPAIATDVNPQVLVPDMSVPALAVVGVACTVILITFDSPATGHVAKQAAFDNRLYHVDCARAPGL